LLPHGNSYGVAMSPVRGYGAMARYARHAAVMIPATMPRHAPSLMRLMLRRKEGEARGRQR